MDIIAAMKNISSGDFGKRVKVTAHSPEMRQLQSMVNRMSESLRSYQQDMEEKVRLVTAELEHKKREAEQANLAKSKFLATASHDLRQPMHAIGLYVESLKPQMQGRAAEDTLNKIERSISSMVELFNAILDVTKLDAGVVQPNIGPIRLRKMFLYLADEFAPEADKKGLSLRVRAPDVWVESDEVLLERILRNLISNAIRHTSQGGILISARPSQGKMRLQVWDTGTGIEPEHQARIFEEFYQAGSDQNQSRQGLGLGLAIVRRLTRLLDYPLQLQSRPGRGTVIAIDLPVTNRAVEEGLYAATEDKTIRGLALVVDDDPSVLDALGNLLKQWGMGLMVANTLQQARQALQTAPDIVLADYQLQHNETGLMVAELVKSRWGDAVPVVLITGDTRTETIKTLRETGLPVLHKPVRVTQLRSVLETLLRKPPLKA
jgi:signal transduction histidine kinase